MGEKPLYRTHLIQRRRFRMRRRSEEVEEHRQVPRDDDRAGARVGRERDGVPARVARLRRRQRQHRVQLLAARARRRARRPRPRQQRQILRAYQPRDGRDDEAVREPLPRVRRGAYRPRAAAVVVSLGFGPRRRSAHRDVQKDPMPRRLDARGPRPHRERLVVATAREPSERRAQRSTRVVSGGSSVLCGSLPSKRAAGDGPPTRAMDAVLVVPAPARGARPAVDERRADPHALRAVPETTGAETRVRDGVADDLDADLVLRLAARRRARVPRAFVGRVRRRARPRVGHVGRGDRRLRARRRRRSRRGVQREDRRDVERERGGGDWLDAFEEPSSSRRERRPRRRRRRVFGGVRVVRAVGADGRPRQRDGHRRRRRRHAVDDVAVREPVRRVRGLARGRGGDDVVVVAAVDRDVRRRRRRLQERSPPAVAAGAAAAERSRERQQRANPRRDPTRARTEPCHPPSSSSSSSSFRRDDPFRVLARLSRPLPAPALAPVRHVHQRRGRAVRVSGYRSRVPKRDDRVRVVRVVRAEKGAVVVEVVERRRARGQPREGHDRGDAAAGAPARRRRRRRRRRRPITAGTAVPVIPPRASKLHPRRRRVPARHRPRGRGVRDPRASARAIEHVRTVAREVRARDERHLHAAAAPPSAVPPVEADTFIDDERERRRDARAQPRRGDARAALADRVLRRPRQVYRADAARGDADDLHDPLVVLSHAAAAAAASCAFAGRASVCRRLTQRRVEVHRLPDRRVRDRGQRPQRHRALSVRCFVCEDQRIGRGRRERPPRRARRRARDAAGVFRDAHANRVRRVRLASARRARVDVRVRRYRERILPERERYRRHPSHLVGGVRRGVRGDRSSNFALRAVRERDVRRDAHARDDDVRGGVARQREDLHERHPVHIGVGVGVVCVARAQRDLVRRHVRAERGAKEAAGDAQRRESMVARSRRRVGGVAVAVARARAPPRVRGRGRPRRARRRRKRVVVVADDARRRRAWTARFSVVVE
eukprot:30904-Pelagococcus_subviridis.AAC.2